MVRIRKPSGYATLNAASRAARVVRPAGGLSLCAASAPLAVRTSASEAKVRSGAQIEAAATFEPPVLTEHHHVASNVGGILQVGTYNNVTSVACQIRFRLVSGKKILVLPWTTPEQTTPHIATLSGIDGITYGGFTYNLEWWWTADGGAETNDGYELLYSSHIYLPAAGEPPTIS